MLYSVLSKSNIPAIPGGYKGPPILQIVENSNNMGTIYIVNILHAKMTSFIFFKFSIQILIHFISYYSIALDRISVPNTSNEHILDLKTQQVHVIHANTE